MKKRHFIAILISALCITACDTGKNTKDAPEQDQTTTEVAEDSTTNEFVLTKRGIENCIALGSNLDALPQQVPGLYDKLNITQQEDEGEVTTMVDFTLEDKSVMTGGSIDGKTLSNLSVMSDNIKVKANDKTWNIGSSSEGLTPNKENTCLEQDSVWILADENNVIYQIFVGEY